MNRTFQGSDGDVWMDVKVDGVPTTRKVASTLDAHRIGRAPQVLQQYPEMREGEILLETIGGDMQIISKRG